MLIVDDFSRDDLISVLGTPWRGFSDQVMGGISEEAIALTTIDGRPALRLTGDVRLENNGGFIQMALDLAPAGRTLDASASTGVLLGSGKDSVQILTHEADDASLAVAVVTAIWLCTKPF